MATAPHSSFEPPLSLPCTAVSSPSCAAPSRLGQLAAAALGPPPASCAAAAARSHVARPPLSTTGQAAGACGFVHSRGASPIPAPTGLASSTPPNLVAALPSRHHSWPSRHGQAPAAPSLSTVARGSPSAPPPLPRCQQVPCRPEIDSPLVSPALCRVRVLAPKFKERQGLICIAQTHVNSAHKDLFVLSLLEI